jgi:hypothetical protein
MLYSENIMCDVLQNTGSSYLEILVCTSSVNSFSTSHFHEFKLESDFRYISRSVIVVCPAPCAHLNHSEASSTLTTYTGEQKLGSSVQRLSLSSTKRSRGWLVLPRTREVLDSNQGPQIRRRPGQYFELAHYRYFNLYS